MSATDPVTDLVPDPAAKRSGSFEPYLELAPGAFAVTSGPQHAVVFANAAFRRLSNLATGSPVGRPIRDAFPGRNVSALEALLDRASSTAVAIRDECIEPESETTTSWYCNIWPATKGNEGSQQMVLELRFATEFDRTIALQRAVTERIFLTALRQSDAAKIAEVSREGAAFLAAEGLRIADSLDEKETLAALTRMSLPQLGAWCIVDIVDDDDSVRRLAIVHRDPTKQELIHELESRWSPDPGDLFGVPAMQRKAEPTLVSDRLDDVLAGTSRDPDVTRIVRALGIGPVLTLPLVIRQRLVGAVTFVAARDQAFTPHDVALAVDLAHRSEMALDRARLYSDAVALTKQAEEANAAKSAFLGSMSHELRTPLNAIGGYAELLDMGVHGPVTAEQHTALARILASQLHLTGLIEDLLNFTKLGSGQLPMDVSDVIVRDAVAASVELVEPLISQKQLVYDGVSCDIAIVAQADAEKLTQVLVNLLSNAIKFTPSGGRITIGCESTTDMVLVHVTDTGIGIPPDKLEAIFDPFVQVKPGLANQGLGVGLGLSISRGLARAMHGDLTVESSLGDGARFTLSLPRATHGDSG